MKHGEHMTLRGLRSLLQAERLRVTPRRIDYAILAGHLPEPSRSTSGQRVWEPREAARVLAYFQRMRG